MNQEKKKRHLENNWQEFDYLTQLPNRYSFERTMKRLLRQEKAQEGQYVLLVDIDDFRLINQGFGYDVGDIIILNLAIFLKARFHHTHKIFRINSDSFLLVCAPSPQPGQLQRDIDTILARCQSPWKISDRHIYYTVGISAVYFPCDGRTLSEVYQNLDSALYKAKEKGGNSFFVYREEIENISNVLIRHREIEMMLREAVKNDYAGFEVHYQPIYQSTTNKIVGVEALLRYTNADGIMISPDAFIPIAERTGLIVPIGQYVLRVASRFCKSIVMKGYPDFFVNVNVSVHELQQPGFIDRTLAALDSIALAHGHIVIEITESVAATSLERIRGTCLRLRETGIQIALDDFGTGYSSLNMIRTMPIDLIKIDRSFVKDLAMDAYTQSFVRMITELGHALGLAVCAEGIEEMEQLLRCRELGIDFTQGYLYHKALPPKEIIAVVQSVNRGDATIGEKIASTEKFY